MKTVGRHRSRRRVVWYDLDEAMWTTPAKSDGKRRKRRTTMEVYDFEFEFRRDKAADAVAGRSLLPPVRIADCASCGWRERCNVDQPVSTHLTRNPANPLRGPRKALRHVPSALRCSSPRNQPETPHTAHERPIFATHRL